MQSSDTTIIKLATKLGETLQKQSRRMAAAESCTGGLLAATCTAVPGSSAWFDCGLVTYSLAAKRRILNVRDETLRRYNAVSEPVAVEMVFGALAKTEASLAVSITGIAGPEGGDIKRAVGTVWFAWASSASGNSNELIQVSRHQFEGNREAVRYQAVKCALEGLITAIGAR